MSEAKITDEEWSTFIPEEHGLRSVASTLLRSRESSIIAAALVLVILFAITSGGKFLASGTWGSILSSAAELGIVTIGVSMLMIGGDFDLSIGANFSFSALLMATMMGQGLPGIVALLVALGMGLGIGLLNGLITVFLQIPSFVATLGTWLIWIGVTLIVTGGSTVTITRNSPMLNILGGPAFGIVRWEDVWWVVIGIIMAVVLHRTPYGNAVYAVGGHSQAAREAGIPVRRVRIMNFMICGLLATVAGVVQLGHLQSMASSYGDYYQLYAIAAAVVGGMVLTGGRGSILGALIGSLILSMLDAGLVLSGVSTFWYQAVIGMIVIVSVAIHTRLGRMVSGGGD